MKVTATAETPPGRNVVPFVVKTDLPKAGLITLLLTVDRGIVTAPPMVFYGLLLKDLKEPRLAAVTIARQKGGFHIKEATVDDPKLQTKLETVRDGAEYRVTVTYAGGWEPGIIRKTLVVTTDDPQQPVLQIPVQTMIQTSPPPAPVRLPRAPRAGIAEAVRNSRIVSPPSGHRLRSLLSRLSASLSAEALQQGHLIVPVSLPPVRLSGASGRSNLSRLFA